MEVQRKSILTVIKYIFSLFFFLSFLFLIVGELVYPRENGKGAHVETLTTEWVQVKPGGIKVPVEVPGKVKAEKGEIVTIETTLPEDMPATWLCFRSSQQDMWIYVDGELRQEYRTETTRPFGNTSMSAYVFLRTNSEDNGSRLTIELKSESLYAGVLNSVYYGDQFDIWRVYISEYGIEILLAFCLMIMAGLTILFGAIFKHFYHRKMLIGYLGSGIFLAASWLIAESRIRQLFFPNISVIGNMAFFVLMLLPLPFIFYMNGIQKDRYQRLYEILSGVYLLNFVYCVVMQLLGRRNLLDTMTMTNILIVAGMCLLMLLIVWDWWICKNKDYAVVAIGLVGLMIMGIIEIIMVYRELHSLKGVPLSVGLAFLLLTAAVKTGQDIFQSEKEKQMAITANASKANFLSNMSHEIRTPINSVIGMNEMILRENKDPVIREYAENIQGASRVLLGLVDDVFDFSRIESGNLEIKEKAYDTSILLSDAIYVLKERAEAKNIHVILQISEQLPSQLKGDEARIHQVLNNLISNAVKFTDEGKITLTVQGEYRGASEYDLIVSVADTGAGIRQEDMDRLYDGFTRLENTTNSSAEGVGLGLNLVKRILDKMHGEIHVQSVYGKGSLFTVMIPQECVDRTPIGDWVQECRIEANIRKSLRNVFRAPEASILAVDDNAMNLSVIRGLLKRTQIKLDLAGGGKECLKLCKDKKYDLILMDHMMPEPNGVQTLHMIREDRTGLNAETKAVVLTANAVSGVREEYLKEGFVDYLSKPVTSTELEEMLCRHLPSELIVYEELEEAGKPEPEEAAEQKNQKTEDNEAAAAMEQKQDNVELLVDEKLGLSYCGDDEEMYREILQVYLEQGQEYQQKLREYYETKDWDSFEIVAHAIKSTSLGIGAAVFSEYAKKQEFAGREKNEAFILESREVFEEKYGQVLAKVRELLGDAQAEEAKELQEISLESYIAECEKLQETIQSFEMNEALKQIEFMQTLQCKEDEQAQEMLSRIRAGVDEFDYDTAESCIQEWIEKLRR